MPRCAVCGQDNPGGFRFCGACGAPLAAPDQAPTEERRLVTVLFCDLVDFTARSDRADPEDVGALLRPYHARQRAEIERRGGRGRKLALLLAVAGAATWLVRRNQRKAELDEGIWHEAPAPASPAPTA